MLYLEDLSMGRHLQELFMASCGLFGKWGVRVFGDNSGISDHTFLAPFTFVGNRSDQDVHLSHPHVSRRHAYFQVLPGGVFCIDLGSRTGIHWDNANQYEGWLRPNQHVRIGPYAMQLISEHQGAWSNADSGWSVANPLADRPSATARVPTSFMVEVSGGGTVLALGKMNRILALVGRSPRCLFHIKDPSLSDFHCSLVRTPAGLWVIDLHSLRGTFLGGRPINIARIQDGDVVQVGNYMLRFRLPCLEAQPHVAAEVGHTQILKSTDTRVMFTETSHASPGVVHPTKPACELSTASIDLMELPEVPPLIMQPRSTEVASSSSPPPGPLSTPSLDMIELPLEPPRSMQPRSTEVASASRRTMLAALDDRVGAEWTMLAVLVDQFNAMQVQMFDRFQEGILKTTQVFANLHKDQMAFVRHELEELRAISAELRSLQGKMTSQTMQTPPDAAAHSSDLPPTAANKDTDRPTMSGGESPNHPANGRSAPEETSSSAKPRPPESIDSSRPAQPPKSPEDLHAWLNQRVASLQQERQSRWDKLMGILTGK
jgi:pSer/pThr/pTyr-binding forkhead associated (FHA) protein